MSTDVAPRGIALEPDWSSGSAQCQLMSSRAWLHCAVLTVLQNIFELISADDGESVFNRRLAVVTVVVDQNLVCSHVERYVEDLQV